MLQSLKIKNVALIEDLYVDFEDKLNILTGETGAGKSIIIDSLTFLLGGRADKSLIRSGQAEAKVTAIFNVDSSMPYVVNFFEKLDLEIDSTVIISRSMNINGKTVSKVNGEFITATMLRDFTAYLVDIHGQNEHQFLLKETNQLQLIDSYGINAIEEKKVEYLTVYNKLKQVNIDLFALGGSEEDRLRQMDILEYQIKELETAELDENEEEELAIKLKRMQNAEKISNSVTSASNALGAEFGDGVLSDLSLAIGSLITATGYDESLINIVEQLKSSKLELEDAISELGVVANSLEYDVVEFETIDERLDYIKKLKRKYGGTIKKALVFLEEAKKELFKLNNSYDQLNLLKSKKKEILKELLHKANNLTASRKEVAENLTRAILNELKDLGMQNSSLEIDFNISPAIETIEQLAKKNGVDNVEFMFSANLGEPVKPLVKIISGGEMSRFMLALKTIIAKTDNIPTMIFDEIDTGISGKMAQAVSYKMAKISRNHQVLVVSHLPQIAAMADNHFFIEKNTIEAKTTTSVKKLDNNLIIEEIARMLSGESLSVSAIDNAKDLKLCCNSFKQNL